ncbi:MAG: phosphoribosylamine--glycine ligase [Desulfobacterales bacterium]|nr:phosphoribosylamine--glycine ligase [Desulfobacterales bacterium]
MKVLVVGSGGREHTLVWKIAQSPDVKKVFCAPGNAGMTRLAKCIPINADDIDGLLAFAKKEAIDLTVVGPEAPLSNGIVDIFEKEDLRIFGPSKKAAQIEASKAFSKNIMIKSGVPTAKGDSFTDYKKADAYLKKMGAPVVVKADGLAAGKGVIVCETMKQAEKALKEIMLDNAYGDAGARVVIEECLKGEEASFIAFTDGKTILPLPTSQDHKAVFDDDKGPNTGGMGAYSPAPVVDPFMHKKIMNEVMIPTVKGMAAEGCPYKGVLYAGLMIDHDKIKVLEFNGRFGDPEAQPLLVRVKSDIVPIMEAVIDEKLDECSLDIDDRASVCIVMASGGYPGKYKKGMVISGLDKAGRMKDVTVFHAGTTAQGKTITATGGRVLGVTALGDTVEKAIEKAYQATSKIRWTNVFFRKDIGMKAVRRLKRKPEVLVIMGSDSDLGVMESAVAIFKKFGISFEMTVASAHRSPAKASALAENAKKRGIKVVIAGAGHAAHLAGVLAAHTILPVIGVPIDSSCLKGMDSLLSTVQMPPGIPVATVSIGKSGAKNAGILAAQILALGNDDLAQKLVDFKKEMAAQVEKKAEKLADYR